MPLAWWQIKDVRMLSFVVWKIKIALPQGRETPPYKHPGVSSFQGGRERKKNPAGENELSYTW